MNQTKLGTKATTVSGKWIDDIYETVVTYYSTEIVRFTSQRIILNSGGYRTMTTKARMNQASYQFALGYDVYQQNGEWFVEFSGKIYDFEDGMTLYF